MEASSALLLNPAYFFTIVCLGSCFFISYQENWKPGFEKLDLVFM